MGAVHVGKLSDAGFRVNAWQEPRVPPQEPGALAVWARFYHACAVRIMLQTRLIPYADLGLGIRGSGRLSQEVFRAPLDVLEAALPKDEGPR